MAWTTALVLTLAMLGADAEKAASDLSQYDRPTLERIAAQWHAAAEALRQQVQELRAENAELRRQLADAPPQPSQEAEGSHEEMFAAKRMERAKQLREEIARLKKQLADGNKGLSVGRMSYGIPYEDQLEAAEGELLAIQTGKWLPLIEVNAIGSVGALSDAATLNHGYDVVSHGSRQSWSKRDGRLMVVRVLDDQRMLVEVGGRVVLLANRSTDGYVDGEAMTIPGLYEVTGTSRGELSGTVYKLEPFNGSP